MFCTCPACGNNGSENVFRYLGNQQMYCGFCGKTLNTASFCPKCKEIMITKNPIDSNLNPFAPAIAAFKMLKGTFSDTNVICRQCGYKSAYKDFKKVLIYGKAHTIIK